MKHAIAVLALLALPMAGWGQDFVTLWDCPTTPTNDQVGRAALSVWEARTVACHDELTSDIVASAISDAAKINLLIQIPQLLRQSGVMGLWKAASTALKKAMLQASADLLRVQALEMEAQVVNARAWADKMEVLAQ